ncbi:MAG TPA: hypothetical protein ENN09_05160, partial [Planctomycetes bacterium]|nr:hypothetical protein [Planctomycetota bacterium]
MLLDVVFDARNGQYGYPVIAKPAGWFDNHPLGEGRPSVFRIYRMHEALISPLWNSAGGALSPALKADLSASHSHDRSTPLQNVFTEPSLKLLPLPPDELAAHLAAFDTRKNAVFSVGSGKTYATISAAISASSSGDVIEVYETDGNTYAEYVSDGSREGLQIIARAAEPLSLTITRSTGIVVNLWGAKGKHIHGFRIVCTGSGERCLYLNSGFAENCVFTGASLRGADLNLGFLHNCLAYANNVGILCTTSYDNVDNCTAVKNTGDGIAASSPTRGDVRACLSAGNGGSAFSTGLALTRSHWNVSDDATAPGAGSVTGFDVDDFIDFAGNDFRLKYAAKD